MDDVLVDRNSYLLYSRLLDNTNNIDLNQFTTCLTQGTADLKFTIKISIAI